MDLEGGVVASQVMPEMIKKHLASRGRKCSGLKINSPKRQNMSCLQKINVNVGSVDV